MGKAETHSTIAHPLLLRNLAKACSFGTQPTYFVVIHGAAGTTKLFPGGPRIADTSAYPLRESGLAPAGQQPRRL